MFKILIEKKPNIKIAVIGTGELEEEIHQFASELQLAPNVEFLGFQNNPYKILHDAKLMIMTSRWEGTPMCVLEAMALGVPVVSTPTDGVKDVVEDGKTGYLSDNDEVLVQKCLKVLGDDELYQKLHQNSLKKATEILDSKTYKAEIDRVYRS